MSTTDPIKVLLLAGEPSARGVALRLDREARAVTSAIRGSLERAVHLETEWAVTTADLQPLLLRHRPQIVHFAGHASRAHGIYLADSKNPVSGEVLRDLFRIMNSFVRVVVLNACETRPAAEAIATVIDCAIGMDTLITDPAAILFAQSFYGALSSSTTLQDAFDLGVNRLLLEKSAESKIPRILLRNGFDARTHLSGASTAAGGDSSLLQNIVRFVASALRGLGPSDFDQVVTALVRATAVSPEVAERLTRAWQESSERILTAFGVRFSGNRLARTGGLTEGTERWEMLERENPLRFHAHLRALHHADLLFGSSDAVGCAVADLQAAVAAEFPADYDARWLMTLVIEALSRAETPSFLLDRVSFLLAGFYARPPLVQAADAVLAEVLLGDGHQHAVGIVQRLLHAPGFPAFDWLRRLADCGHEPALSAVRDLLEQELWRTANVYALLEELKTWLPPCRGETNDLRSSGRLALRLVLEYALSSTQRVPASEYEQWPTSCALLEDPVDIALERRMALLCAWIFHPALPRAVFGDGPRAVHEARRVQASLVEHWVFILGAPRLRAPAADDSASFGPHRVATTLLASIHRFLSDCVNGVETERALLSCWEDTRLALSEAIERVGPGRSVARRELVHRRSLLRATLERMRALSRRAGRGR